MCVYWINSIISNIKLNLTLHHLDTLLYNGIYTGSRIICFMKMDYEKRAKVIFFSMDYN